VCVQMAEVPVGCVIVAPPSEGEQGSRAKIQILASGHNMCVCFRLLPNAFPAVWCGQMPQGRVDPNFWHWEKFFQSTLLQ